MQKKIKKNIKQRYFFQKFEKNSLTLKIISKNLFLSQKILDYVFYAQNKHIIYCVKNNITNVTSIVYIVI